MCFQLRFNSGNAIVLSFPFIAFGLMLPSYTTFYNFVDVRKINKLAFSRNFNFKLKIISDNRVLNSPCICLCHQRRTRQ